MSENNCWGNGGIKCWDGTSHSFEPRYDEESKIDQEALDKGIKFYNEDSTAPMIEYKTKSKIYLFDICTRCGLKIERNESNVNKNE